MKVRRGQIYHFKYKVGNTLSDLIQYVGIVHKIERYWLHIFYLASTHDRVMYEEGTVALNRHMMVAIKKRPKDLLLYMGLKYKSPLYSQMIKGEVTLKDFQLKVEKDA